MATGSSGSSELSVGERGDWSAVAVSTRGLEGERIPTASLSLRALHN